MRDLQHGTTWPPNLFLSNIPWIYDPCFNLIAFSLNINQSAALIVLNSAFHGKALYKWNLIKFHLEKYPCVGP